MESIKELKSLLAESRERNDERSVANIAYKLGDRYLERGKLDQELPLLRESYTLCEEHGNTQGSAVVALSLATAFLREADTDQAGTYARHAYSFFEKDQEPKNFVKACQIQGDLYWRREDPESALPYYRQALDLCRQHQDTLGTATFLDRMATQHRLLGREDEARLSFIEALELWAKLGIPDRQAVTLVHLADIHKRKGEFRQAIRLYEQARPLYQGIKNMRAMEILEKELSRLQAEIEKEEPVP